MSTIYAQRENYTPLIAEQVTGGTRDVYINCSWCGSTKQEKKIVLLRSLSGRIEGDFLRATAS